MKLDMKLERHIIETEWWRRIVCLLIIVGFICVQAACRVTSNVGDALYTLAVIPAAMEAIEGQRCMLLIQITEDQGSAPVALTVIAQGATVELSPSSTSSGEVAEAAVTPDEGTAGTTLTVNVHAERGSVIREQNVVLTIVAGEDSLGEVATEIRDRFVAYLEANVPTLGITSGTAWEGTIVTPDIMIVSHYLFYSDEWEMGVSWHVMIPPDDWGKIYLRRRYTQAAPLAAYMIDSLANQGAEPHADVVPEIVSR